jgi:hypothetical protein
MGYLASLMLWRESMRVTRNGLTLAVALGAVGLLVLGGACLLDDDASGADLCYQTSLLPASLVGLPLVLEAVGRFTPAAAPRYRSTSADLTPPPPRSRRES